MIFLCSLCGCMLYNPFKSYCEDCQKVRRMMLLNDKAKFINKLEEVFLNGEFKEIPNEKPKITYSDVIKKSKTTDDLQILEKAL